MNFVSEHWRLLLEIYFAIGIFLAGGFPFYHEETNLRTKILGSIGVMLVGLPLLIAINVIEFGVFLEEYFQIGFWWNIWFTKRYDKITEEQLDNMNEVFKHGNWFTRKAIAALRKRYDNTHFMK